VSSNSNPPAQFVEDLLAAFQPLVEHIYRVAADLQPALRQLTEVCEAVQRGELSVEPAPPVHGCHCLCGMHKADGMFCAGEASGAIPLTGPLGLVVVPMCDRCARWWLNRCLGELAGAR
jgi:hypothetical protein